MHHRDPIVDVTALNFESEVLNADIPVLIDITAAWCPPCRAAKPTLSKLANAHPDLKVVRVHGEESPDLVARLKVRGFPTFVLYDQGQELRRQAGFAGPLALERFVSERQA